MGTLSSNYLSTKLIRAYREALKLRHGLVAKSASQRAWQEHLNELIESEEHHLL